MSKSDEQETTPTEKKIEELYELIGEMEIALMTTHGEGGQLVTRPMATQKQEEISDLWFVTSIETHKIEELGRDGRVSLGYYNSQTREWVSVSGHAKISQDREKIRELYEPDWKAWFSDEGGERDGGPDDPRLALILVEARSVIYMKNRFSKPRMLFELAKGFLTGEAAELGREERLSKEEL